jgi:hypothetical protein
MALCHECMQSCAHIVLDTADIVKDGDFTPATTWRIGILGSGNFARKSIYAAASPPFTP